MKRPRAVTLLAVLLAIYGVVGLFSVPWNPEDNWSWASIFLRLGGGVVALVAAAGLFKMQRWAPFLYWLWVAALLCDALIQCFQSDASLRQTVSWLVYWGGLTGAAGVYFHHALRAKSS